MRVTVMYNIIDTSGVRRVSRQTSAVQPDNGYGAVEQISVET